MTLSPTPTRQLAPERLVLSNGIVLLVAQNPTADIVAARLFLRAGSRHQTPLTAGVISLLASLLTKGTETLSSFEIAERVEYAGASLGTDTATDYLLVSLKSVTADFANLLALVADIIRRPTFPESEVELEQRLLLQAIRSQQERPFSIAFDQLRRALYGQHPYALSALGTPDSVSQLGRKHLQQFHRTHFRPENLVISIAGCITPEDAKRQVEGLFGDWLGTTAPEVSTPECLAIQPDLGFHWSVQDTQQAIVMLGYLAPSVQSEAYAPMKLLTSYLGNGMSSRLFVELREKRGLAYDVSVIYPTRLDTAPFVAYMGTAPDNASRALEGLRYEVDRLKAAPLSESELKATTTKLLGQYALGKQTNAQIAQIFGWYEILGLGLDFDMTFQRLIQAVTPEDVQRTADYYCQEPTISLVGSQAAIQLAQENLGGTK